MTRHLSLLALVVSLGCFFVALLMTSGAIHPGNYHAWVDGAFVALVLGLIIERQ